MNGEIRLAKNFPATEGQKAHRIAFAINFKEVTNDQWSVTASGGSVGAEFSTTVNELLEVKKARAAISHLVLEAVGTGYSVTKMVMPDSNDSRSEQTLLGVHAEEASLKIARSWAL